LACAMVDAPFFGRITRFLRWRNLKQKPTIQAFQEN